MNYAFSLHLSSLLYICYHVIILFIMWSPNRITSRRLRQCLERMLRSWSRWSWRSMISRWYSYRMAWRQDWKDVKELAYWRTTHHGYRTSSLLIITSLSRYLVRSAVFWAPPTFTCAGQYTGNNKPLPEYHVKISSFDEKVVSMILLL